MYNDPNVKGPLNLSGAASPHVATLSLAGVFTLFAALLLWLDLEAQLQRVLGKAVPALFVSFVVLAGWLNQFCAAMTAYHRQQLSVPLPFYYPSLEDVPNKADRHVWLCVVRVHQNYLEFLPQMLGVSSVAFFVCGLPALASTLGIWWCCARYFYARGYSSGFPQRRLAGFIFSLIPYFTLHGLCGVWAVHKIFLA